MKPIHFWRLADELTVVQAALLLCECDPSDYQDQVRHHNASHPVGYAAAIHSLLSAVATKKLSSRSHYESDQHGDGYTVDELAQIPVVEIRDWLRGKGYTEHPFFLPHEPQDEFLSPNHPRYSAKLAAAVTAWRELENPSLIKGTPKQSLQKWLRLNAVTYGLCDDDGKPMESAITDIAKVANWKTKGGAPSTPYGSGLTEPASGLTEPTTGSHRNPTTGKKLSLGQHKNRSNSDDFEIDLDDEIPF